ncbi:unnamed protein product [Ambrosiozyma monospora]|uniref:Unnamed protein product n=1 Tax=Ambrosiozyma monospora TaxID=43982 RepID=A0ACB5T2C9_AMBMO|nr:unnamed protein product [Ambrosiozyma monospora]
MSSTKQPSSEAEDDVKDLTIKELWKLLDNWLKTNAPKAYESLNPPITETKLQQLEAEFGLSLPEGYKESLRVHNGSSDDAYGCGGCEYLSHTAVMRRWEFYVRRYDGVQLKSDDIESHAPEIRTVMYFKKWVPITFHIDLFSYCIDLDPTE